ncbi:MAG: hypothetical protein Q4F65_00965 [Propionibacteriaceae bacterium]|nr:hypothetical protein [Propionibacteriaceae bacterium]
MIVLDMLSHMIPAAAIVAAAYLAPCLPVIVRDLLTTENKDLK